MKDLHNHSLFGIDDGATSLDDSISILNKLYSEGFTDIVLTPHYIIGSIYSCNNKKKDLILKEIKSNTKIKLYIGNEVMIDNNIVSYINSNEISTINNSKYILIEFPLNYRVKSLYDILYNIIISGYVPIIAHPERYHYLSIYDFEKFIYMGCLLQGNMTSLYGKYGTDSKHNLELLLKKHMIHVLGTDSHRVSNINLSDIKSILSKFISDEMCNDLLINNFDKIVNNINVVPYEIKSVETIFKKEIIK